MYDIISLNEKLLPELKEIAKKLSIQGADSLKKQDLIYKIVDHQALSPETVIKKKSEPVIAEKQSEKITSQVEEKPAEKLVAVNADSDNRLKR